MSMKHTEGAEKSIGGRVGEVEGKCQAGNHEHGNAALNGPQLVVVLGGRALGHGGDGEALSGDQRLLLGDGGGDGGRGKEAALDERATGLKTAGLLAEEGHRKHDQLEQSDFWKILTVLYWIM